jgi:hypothetical protein
VAVVFDHEQMVKDMWADPTMARLLEYPQTRVAVPGEIRDSWDGSILKSQQLKAFTEESKYNLVWDFSSDSAVIETSEKRSYTPLTSRCHNLGPHVRSQLTTVSMFGMAGPGFVSFQPLIKLAVRVTSMRTQPTRMHYTRVRIHSTRIGCERYEVQRARHARHHVPPG